MVSQIYLSGGGRRWLLACTAGLLVLAGGWSALAEGKSTPKFHEYEVKAAFLLNFMQFVEWPVAAATTSGAPLVIGVLGEDPFGSMLDETIKGETVQGRSLQVKRERKAVNLKDCQLVFVCRSEKTLIKEILGALRGCSVLTVSDVEGFCRNGGMIGLINEGGKIRFEINQAVAEQDNLKISSKLLRLGRPRAK